MNRGALGVEESDRSAVRWIRAGFARIHRTSILPTGREVEANEVIAAIRLHGFSVDTRQRPRVSTKISRLAWDFVIVFARNQVGDGRDCC